MRKTMFLTITILALSLNASPADIFIGHAYYLKCPYYGCDGGEIYARPLFEKKQNDWQAFPNGEDIGNTPDALYQSYKLFPNEIKWYIFNDDYSLIGKATVENLKPVEWRINAGAAQMRMDSEIIKHDSDVERGYNPSADLILSTNENVIFSKFKTRITTDIKIYESAIKNIRGVGYSTDFIGTIEKYATIYSVDNEDVIAILNFKHITEDIIDTNSLVLAKKGKIWEFVFDGDSLDYDKDIVYFSLIAIADFDNDEKNEYLFNLSSGVNRFGYVLWHDGIAKPLVYKFNSH